MGEIGDSEKEKPGEGAVEPCKSFKGDEKGLEGVEIEKIVKGA